LWGCSTFNTMKFVVVVASMVGLWLATTLNTSCQNLIMNASFNSMFHWLYHSTGSTILFVVVATAICGTFLATTCNTSCQRPAMRTLLVNPFLCLSWRRSPALGSCHILSELSRQHSVFSDGLCNKPTLYTVTWQKIQKKVMDLF